MSARNFVLLSSSLSNLLAQELNETRPDTEVVAILVRQLAAVYAARLS